MNVRTFAIVGILAIALVALYATVSTAGEEGKWVGVITEDKNFKAESGEMYRLPDTEISKELAEHVGKRVEIKGAVSEKEGERFIKVSSYELLKE